jgi:folate-dependent phosphoribosylglycinamide formyltransferase PurN
MKRDWVAFFSQTGTEIANISVFHKSVPTCIVHNKRNLDKVNSWVLQQVKKQSTSIIQLPAKPTVDDYFSVLEKYKNPIITLHGYLRIIPKEICEKYEMYNLHPGLITKYPDLKGKDPQDRAFHKKYPTIGCVIHRVTPEVDSGEIMLEHEINSQHADLDRLYVDLHALASVMWCHFLNKYV